MPKPCRNHQVRDPVTNRCRKRLPEEDTRARRKMSARERLQARQKKERELKSARNATFDMMDMEDPSVKSWFVRMSKFLNPRRPPPAAPPIVSGISGPHMMLHMRHVGMGMDVYLFGELHKSTECPSDYTRVDVYLDELIRSSPKFIDVFVESSVYVDPMLHIGSGLGYLRELFLWCIGERSRCPYTNARIHFNDLRSLPDDRGGARYRHFLLDIIGFKDDTEPSIHGEYLSWVRNLEAKTDLVLSKYDIDPKDTIARFLTVNLLRIPRIRRNLNNVDVKVKLVPFIYKQFRLVLEKELLVTVRALVMDLYGLARMFKDFGEGPMPRHAKNIIMYSGSVHTETHARFLDVMGFKVVESVRSNSNNLMSAPMCVDMTGIKQPLFASGDE